MRSFLPVISAVALLVCLGAGCASKAPVTTQDTKPYATDTPTPVPSTPDTYATNPTSSSNPTPTPEPNSPTPSMQTPTNLAFPGILPAAEANKKIRIKTNKGDIVIQTSVEMGARAASNFVYLVKQGFYNGTIFHRVIPGFMIQGGDPTGTGMGGPGYQFSNDEVRNRPSKTISVQGQSYTGPVYEDGWVAMANAGRNTNGSQFFIMVADYPLPPDYSVFGKVVEGLDVAHKIANTARDLSDRPNEEVKMISVTLE